nr:hypothetical protein Itr_chr15CG02060 [Ipomoea trifida]
MQYNYPRVSIGHVLDDATRRPSLEVGETRWEVNLETIMGKINNGPSPFFWVLLAITEEIALSGGQQWALVASTLISLDSGLLIPKGQGNSREYSSPFIISLPLFPRTQSGSPARHIFTSSSMLEIAKSIASGFSSSPMKGPPAN